MPLEQLGRRHDSSRLGPRFQLGRWLSCGVCACRLNAREPVLERLFAILRGEGIDDLAHILSVALAHDQ